MDRYDVCFCFYSHDKDEVGRMRDVFKSLSEKNPNETKMAEEVFPAYRNQIAKRNSRVSSISDLEESGDDWKFFVSSEDYDFPCLGLFDGIRRKCFPDISVAAIAEKNGEIVYKRDFIGAFGDRESEETLSALDSYEYESSQMFLRGKTVNLMDFDKVPARKCYLSQNERKRRFYGEEMER